MRYARYRSILAFLLLGYVPLTVLAQDYDRWDGVITKVVKHTAYIKFDAPGRKVVKVVFDGDTQFNYCLSTDHKGGCSLNDVKVGTWLETVGIVLGKKELRATRVLHIQQQ
jgi:hypothetical protein